MERPRKRPGSLDLGRICFARLLCVVVGPCPFLHGVPTPGRDARGADDGFRLAGLTTDLGSYDFPKNDGWVLRSSGWRFAPEVDGRDLSQGHSPTWRSP
jgi:hypothetical protein